MEDSPVFHSDARRYEEVAMEDNILFDASRQLQIRGYGKALVIVPFPVCLAIKHENDLIETCPILS